MSQDYSSDVQSIKFNTVEALVDEDGSIKFVNDYLASSNFDGVIPRETSSVTVSDLTQGQYLGIYNVDGGIDFYPITRIEREDPILSDSYSGSTTVSYIDENKNISNIIFLETDQVVTQKEIWDEKYIGTSGWIITQQGNAIFSNVAVRGDLEATTLNVGGPNGIIYDGASVTIGSDVTINASLTVNSLTVGISPTLLQISNDVNSGSGGIYIDPYNYWYANGQFGVGGTGGSVKWDGSNLSITGNINATSGSFTGDITAQSGRFTGSVSVSSTGAFYAGNATNGVVITSSGLYGYNDNLLSFSIPTVGSPTIAGFTILNTALTGSGTNAQIVAGDANNKITISGNKTSGANAKIFTTIGGVNATATSGSGFYIDDAGKFRLAGGAGYLIFDGSNLAISGSIIGTDGSFTGSVTARTITANTGVIGGFTLSASSLTASTSTAGTFVGVTTTASAFFAGATSNTGAEAKFWVSRSGSMFAQGANISGDSIINGTNIGTGGGNDPSNLRVGTNALSLNQIGTNNIALGSYALYSASAGTNNIAIGPSALYSAISPDRNIAIGYSAMSKGTSTSINSADRNIAIGEYSLYNVTTGDNNIAIGGTSALFSLTTGFSNIALGPYAAQKITVGGYNIAIGDRSLFSGTGTSGNISIGYSAGYNIINGDLNTIIGHNVSAWEGNYNILIGSYSGNNRINDGNYTTYIGYHGNSGENTSSVTYIGYSDNLAIRIDSDLKTNLLGGLSVTGSVQISQSASITNNLVVSNGNIQIGDRATNFYAMSLNGELVTGTNYNIAAGLSAGSDNLFLNTRTGGKIVFRINNASTGKQLEWDDSLGLLVRQSASALNNLYAGGEIIGLGSASINKNLFVSRGTIIDGSACVNGNMYIPFGTFTMINGSASFFRNVFIDKNLFVNDSASANRFLAGDGSTTAPAFSFYNDPDTGIMSYISNQIAFTTNGAVRNIIGTDFFSIGEGSDNSITTFPATVHSYFSSNGGYSIMRSTAATLSVPPLRLARYNTGYSGTAVNLRMLTFYAGNATSTIVDLGGINAGSINTPATPTFASPSDYRLKDDIQDFNYATELIKNVKLRSFKWKHSGQYDVGFVAHELSEVSKELVDGEKDALDDQGNPEYQSIMYGRIVPYVAGAVKENILDIEKLYAKIEQLENRIKELENNGPN